MSKLFEFNLRPLLSIVVLGITALSVNSCAHAQTSVQANVPFAFQNGSQHLSAGLYTLSIDGSSDIMMIRGRSASGMTLVRPDSSTKAATHGKLVFNKYGDQYFLREVWAPGSTTHVRCPKSAAEKRAQSEELAKTDVPRNEVEVAVLDLPR